MNITTLALFIPTCFALNMAPGPNNLLSVNHATRYGFRISCIAGAGRLLAFAGMIALAATGLAVALQASAAVFHAIRLAGAAYLFYLATRLWYAPPRAVAEDAARPASLFALARQECFVAVGNPKAILIFTAFLPQFVDPSQPTLVQFVMLGAIFLFLEWIAIGIYAYMGVHMRRWFSRPRGQRLFNRGCSALLAAAGVGFLLSRRA